MPRAALTPTWWLLVQLDLPELSGYRLRAIGPLSWTGVRALGARWEQAFGAGTTAFTERPAARRVDVGVRPVQPAAAPVSVSIETLPVVAARVPRSKPARPAPPAKPAQRRAPGQSRLSSRARAALARTAAARAAIDAGIAGLELQP